MIHPEYNRDALAVIGGIIVTWAAIEKQVASSVQMIEMELAVAANAWPPQYTDLSSLRGFKERKGHLRRLIENHGSAADLRALDQIFQRLTKPAEARHAFGHDLVNIMPKGNDGPQLINILNLGNIAREQPPEAEWKTVDEVRLILAGMETIQVEILGITGNVLERIRGA